MRYLRAVMVTAVLLLVGLEQRPPNGTAGPTLAFAQTGGVARARQSSSGSDAEREFWQYRMATCQPVVNDAQELRHQENTLLIIEMGIDKEYNQRGTSSAQQKAQSAIGAVSEAQGKAIALRKKFSLRDFAKVKPDWFADLLNKECHLQAEDAKITQERARVLKEYAQTGDAELLVGLARIDKQLNAAAEERAKFEKPFLQICFSPPGKL